jgi:hypothetical protein
MIADKHVAAAAGSLLVDVPRGDRNARTRPVEARSVGFSEKRRLRGLFHEVGGVKASWEHGVILSPQAKNLV